MPELRGRDWEDVVCLFDRDQMQLYHYTHVGEHFVRLLFSYTINLRSRLCQKTRNNFTLKWSEFPEQLFLLAVQQVVIAGSAYVCVDCRGPSIVSGARADTEEANSLHNITKTKFTHTI